MNGYKFGAIVLVAYFLLLAFLSWSPEYKKEKIIINRIFVNGKLVTVDTLKIK